MSPNKAFTMNKSTSQLASKLSNNHSSATLLIATCALLVLLASIVQVECLFKRMQYHEQVSRSNPFGIRVECWKEFALILGWIKWRKLEQGTHGPKSYKFGFTSGDHKNPMERHETSDSHGHVKGWYSFVDPYGKQQVIHYSSHPKHGFSVLNHNSKAHNNGLRHYGS